MATQILAAGTTEASSADVVVSAGSSLTVAIKDVDGKVILGGAVIKIQLKDDANQYVDIGELTSAMPAQVITGAGTYRFVRQAGGPSVGVFSG